MIKLLKSKRGVAMELAIVFLLIMMCFCTVLVTLSMSLRSQEKLGALLDEQYVALMQLGEDFARTGNAQSDLYTVQIDGNTMTVYSGETKVLTVTKENGQITRFCREGG